jgi:heavy metal sensor kinase
VKKITKTWWKIDPFSLRLRLTIGIAAVSSIGLSSLAIWTTWKMQQILIYSHKNYIEEIAARFPRDVELYSQMIPPEEALKKSINNLPTPKTFIWVANDNNKILAQSKNLDNLPQSTPAKLSSLSKMNNDSLVYKVNQHYFVLCGVSLNIKGKLMGKLFVAQDVTGEQGMFVAVVQSLTVTSAVVIILITLAIAFYINRSLQTLRQLSQMTEVISPTDLAEAKLHLDNAPSEVKELADTVNMLLSRLSQSWEQERQFVSNVSHELRTPLTIVHGYLQSVLRRQNNLTQTQKEALETAALEAEHTIRLLQDLLDLARADSGNLHFQIKYWVLNDLVAEVVGMAHNYSDREIKIEQQAYPVEAKADFNRLKQVLLNLIDNAVKYSKPDTPITITLNKQGHQAIIEVSDQGDGIPLQHQSRIFERFYRVDESRNSATGGTGLGLSIVKTLVEGMGGSVTVRSKLGEGSVFSVALPI